MMASLMLFGGVSFLLFLSFLSRRWSFFRDKMVDLCVSIKLANHSIINILI